MYTNEHAQKIYDWIMARFDENRTVYITTYLKSTKATAKHRSMFRVRGVHCEIQRGRNWDSINGCRISAI